MIKTLSFDATTSHARLSREKITSDDLPLIRRLQLKDWNGVPLREDGLVKRGHWVVNPDRSIVFVGAGGGSFEIPEMFDLYYEEYRIRLECGGAGARGRVLNKRADGGYDIDIFVTSMPLPAALAQQQDAIQALVVEAFAAGHGNPAAPPALKVHFTVPAA